MADLSNLSEMDTPTAVISTCVGAGILYAVIKRKGFTGIAVCALGFGLVGVVLSHIIVKTTT